MKDSIFIRSCSYVYRKIILGPCISAEGVNGSCEGIVVIPNLVIGTYHLKVSLLVPLVVYTKLLLFLHAPMKPLLLFEYTWKEIKLKALT